MYSNYTSGGVQIVPLFPNDDPDADGFIHGNFDIEFTYGLTFTDIVMLNFSVTVDPTKKRLPGSPNVEAPVVMQPICRVSQMEVLTSPGGM